MDEILAIIHTTDVTIDPLRKLVKEYMPNVRIINYLDDSMLYEMLKSNSNTIGVKTRFLQYAKYAYSQKANCILSACSTVGEIAEEVDEVFDIPVLRIDEPMIDSALNKGEKIAVAATVSSTLNPTLNLLKRKAKEKKKKIEVKKILLEEAYKVLKQGDKEKHDEIIRNEIKRVSDEVDVIVLAQASMANATSGISKSINEKILTSPRLGIKRVAQILGGKNEQI